MVRTTTYSTQVLGSSTTQPFSDLYFDIRVESTDQVLVTNNVTINSTDNLFDFEIGDLLTAQFVLRHCSLRCVCGWKSDIHRDNATSLPLSQNRMEA